LRRTTFASLVALALGAGLLVAASVAGSATASPAAASKTEARGGTLRVDSRSDFDYIDPALAYFSHSWQLQNATQLKLLGFPDVDGPAGSRLRAEAATALPRVSNGGKTYTFTVRKGFRFSNGRPVTAANFAAALNRALNPKMQSPAASFLDDVVGAKAVLDGKAQRATGVKARGRTLTVTLTRVAPDFLARMTMPFFSAIPANLPAVAEGVNAPLVSAGPYYVKEWVKSRTALAVRNPYWNNAREPYRSLQRPANVNAISWTFGNSLEATKLRLDQNQTDLGNIAPAAVSGLADRYGLNKDRFFIRKEVTFWYLGLNNESDLFRGNTKLRQAVNWAIDRPQMVRQHGYLAGGRTDQILPPGMPGFKNWSIYPLGGVNNASLTKAKSLATSNALRGGKAVFYAFNTAFGPTVAQVVQFNLKQIGIDVEIKQFDRVVQHEKVGTRGEPFDIAHSGWGADYADPSNFINVLLDGSRIQATNNVNESYFNDPAFNKRMAEAAALSGDARLNAYGALDRDITKNAAPLATYINTNGRYYVSQSTGCFTVDPTHGVINLVAICKK
jgi:peptide/nickel transport system substrate-binding protein